MRQVHALVRAIRAALCGATAGCGLFGPGSQMGQLNEARDRWKSQGFTDYQITVDRSCFCVREATGEVYMVVRNAAVAYRTYVSTGQPVAAQWAELFPDIPGLFRVIEDAIHDADDLVVRYHPRLGYPESISIDFVVNAIDDEVAYTTVGFQPFRDGLDAQR